MIVVANKRKWRPNGVAQFLCARPSPLGNPFVLDVDGDREEVIAKFDAWIDAELAKPDSPAAQEFERILRTLRRESKVVLLCWCAPKRCHVETIKARLEARLK